MSNSGLKKAVVVGATGRVGREIVGQLLINPRWGSVVAVGRHETDPPAAYKSQTGYDESKLKQAIVDMDKLEVEAKEAFAGADSVFCCLGTTRAAAGSADQFRKVDLHYVEATARAAKAASVPHFSLVSAQGAWAGAWASDLKPFHGLLYMKTKGQVEEFARAQGFLYTSIMRPGLLKHGGMTRGVEKLFSMIMSSVECSQVAHVMIAEGEKWHDGHTAMVAAEPVVKVFEMEDIQKYT